jgi:hypothetical protein
MLDAWLNILSVLWWCMLSDFILDMIMVRLHSTVFIPYCVIMVAYIIHRSMVRKDAVKLWEWIKSKLKADKVLNYYALHGHRSIRKWSRKCPRYYVWRKKGKSSRVIWRHSQVKSFHLAIANVFTAKTKTTPMFIKSTSTQILL